MEKNSKSEIRKSYLLNNYVIITPGRAKRPRDVKEETVIKRTGKCVFCPANLDGAEAVDSIGEKEDWQVLAIKNKFPAVSPDNEKAYGYQEVIVETPSHTKELAHLEINEIENVLKMYASRTKALADDKKIDYILCFKNQGSKAGASIIHAHSQVFATHILPPDIRDELAAAANYRVAKGSCPYCDIIMNEMNGPRKISEDQHTAVFAPYASQYHYEAWVFAKRHVDNITKLTPEEMNSFAKALKMILLKLDSIDISFNFFLHQVISDHDQHFYLKIQPRDSVWAGVELGSGFVVNSVPPEAAADFYREQLDIN